MPCAPSSGIEFARQCAQRAPAFLIPSGRCHLRAVALRQSSVLRLGNAANAQDRAAPQSLNRLSVQRGNATTTQRAIRGRKFEVDHFHPEPPVWLGIEQIL